MTNSKTQSADRQSWDDYFYDFAKLVASRSRDDCPVGAVIVDDDQVVVATGYNGLPRRVADIEDRLKKTEKLKWTVHAEANAICNAARVGTSAKNCTVYVTKFPCSACAGALVQVGIKRLVSQDSAIWKHDPNLDDGGSSLRILMEAGVEIHAPHIVIGEIRRKNERKRTAKKKTVATRKKITFRKNTSTR